MRVTKRSLGVIAVIAIGAASFGCNSPGSVAAFPGVKTPVMLGPKDRIGSGPALATSKQGEFESEAVFSFTQRETQSYSETLTEWTGSGKLGADARSATSNSEAVDIRLTDVMPAGYTVFSGMKVKSYVSVEGEVVKVQPKGGK